MEILVFSSIVLARFLVPLWIPRYPLPAIVLALVIDAADQTIFAAFNVEPANYQGYDKALDIYYLTMAYLSTIRNWTSGSGFVVGQFLWYYRLIGVVAFELTSVRALLLIFPNTFEYFFIFYEAVRLWWNPASMSRRLVIGSAAAIWIFIKLPQEYWVHIAQLDVTDELAAHPWLWGLMALGAFIVGVVGWLVSKRLPPPEWSATFAVDAHPTTVLTAAPTDSAKELTQLEHPLIEKTLLVGLVGTIFLQLLPEATASVVRVTIGVGAIVVASSFISYWLDARGSSWAAVGRSFLGTGVINLGLAFVFGLLPDRDAAGGHPLVLSLFMIGLLTLIVVLYDRYRALRLTSALGADRLAVS